MTDYIKREDAIRQIVKTSAQNELDIPAIGTVIYILSEMDSADVRENVRGEWETSFGARLKTDGQHWLDCRCTACGLYSGQASDFCPNCGADMRGDNNGQTTKG